MQSEKNVFKMQNCKNTKVQLHVFKLLNTNVL